MRFRYPARLEDLQQRTAELELMLKDGSSSARAGHGWSLFMCLMLTFFMCFTMGHKPLKE